MIPIPTNKPIGIMLPSSNKALAAVLKEATPEQLAVLSQPGKDIKSVLSDLLNDTLGSDRSNKVILDLLKGSPLFKNLGNFTTDLKQLLAMLKHDHASTTIQSALKSFIATVETMDDKTLQKQIADSGVFLESKLAAKADPITSLKSLLENAAALLKQENTPEAKIAQQLVTTLLEGKQFTAPSLATPEPKSVQLLLQDLKALVAQLEKTTTLTSATVSKALPAELPKVLETVIDKLQAFTKESFLKPESFAPKEITQLLTQLSDKVDKALPSQSSSSLLPVEARALIADNKVLTGIIERLLFKLEALPPLQTTSTAALTSFVDQKVPQDIKALIGQLQETLQLSKQSLPLPELASVTEKLARLTKPGELLPGVTVKEHIATDVKVLLLQMSDDVKKADLPGSLEISRQIDKLMVQIDYYQLLSHLSSSNYLYVPYEWELLEQGGMSFKKGEKEGFYCEIDLRLREYGELRLMLSLHDKTHLDITILTEKESLKAKFKAHNQALRAAITAADLTPGQIRLYDMDHAQTPQPYSKQESHGHLDLGFEVKV